VHGGYVDVRCWQAHFLPYFASRGFDCYALDLSGHGHSEAREPLDTLSLDDYLADVLQVIADLGRTPVVIGHSMGAYLAERVLDRVPRARRRDLVLLDPARAGPTPSLNLVGYHAIDARPLAAAAALSGTQMTSIKNTSTVASRFFSFCVRRSW
jgi:pimeloyl-ACP methyl ester carboxylesterase